MSRQNYITDLILKKLHDSRYDIVKQWNDPFNFATKFFYIDNFLPLELCAEIFNAFPNDADGFFSRDSFREKKKVAAHLSCYDPLLSDITYAIQNEKVINLISSLINFDQIEPDPLLYAGGLSMMFKGDFLNPHIDNSHDSNRSRYRRLNALYYVSPNWSVNNGGNLELWDLNKEKSIIVPSIQNRFVIMETNRFSWHSVSKVLIENPRCCISNYYFSKKSPENFDYYHVTSFTGRPGEKFKRFISSFDNTLRNFLSNSLKLRRGRFHINRSKLIK